MRGAVLVLLLLVAGCSSGTSGLALGQPGVDVARAALRGGSPQVALQVTNDLLARQPDDEAALILHGDALTALGEFQQATEDYTRVLKRDPASVDAHIGLGRLRLGTNPAAAEALFLEALQHDPRNTTALNDLGIARDLQGRHTDAQQAYSKALGIDPELHAAQVNLALSLAMTGNSERALNLLQPLASQPGASRKLRQDLAAVLAMGGNQAEAQRILSADLTPQEIEQALAAYVAARTGTPPPLPPVDDEGPAPTRAAVRPAAPVRRPATPPPPNPPVAPSARPSAAVTPASPPTVPPAQASAAAASASPPAEPPARPSAAVTPASPPAEPPPRAPAAAAPANPPAEPPARPSAAVTPASLPAEPTPRAPEAAAPANPPADPPARPSAAAASTGPSAAPVSSPAMSPDSPSAAPQKLPSAATPDRSSAAAPDALSLDTAGGAQVQFAATPSAEAAQAAWQRLQARMPRLLTGREPLFIKVVRGDSTFWRLRTGGFENPADAQAFCARVRGAGGACLAYNEPELPSGR